MIATPMTPEGFAQIANVSRETLADLIWYVELLQKWNETHNLVGSASLSDVWRRHILDSAQINELIPSSTDSLMDIGTGAGLPGIVLAILCKAQSKEPDIYLVESNSRKCAFLRTIVQGLKLDATIICERIERLKPFAVDVITARALAPLAELLDLAEPFVTAHTRCLFPKGRHFEGELTQATKYWIMKTTRIPSKSDPSSRILCLEGIRRV